MRAVAHSKSNYAKEGPAILFELKKVKGFSQPRVKWCGVTYDVGADSILTRPPDDRGRPNEEREDAKKFLKDILANGPLGKSPLERMAEARSISKMTLRRAAEDLGVIKGKDGKISIWSLPDEEDGEDEKAA